MLCISFHRSTAASGVSGLETSRTVVG